MCTMHMKNIIHISIIHLLAVFTCMSSYHLAWCAGKAMRFRELFLKFILPGWWLFWYYTTIFGTIPPFLVLYHHFWYYTTIFGTIPPFLVLYHHFWYYTTIFGTIPFLVVVWEFSLFSLLL